MTIGDEARVTLSDGRDVRDIPPYNAPAAVAGRFLWRMFRAAAAAEPNNPIYVRDAIRGRNWHGDSFVDEMKRWWGALDLDACHDSDGEEYRLEKKDVERIASNVRVFLRTTGNIDIFDPARGNKNKSTIFIADDWQGAPVDDYVANGHGVLDPVTTAQKVVADDEPAHDVHGRDLEDVHDSPTEPETGVPEPTDEERPAPLSAAPDAPEIEVSEDEEPMTLGDDLFKAAERAYDFAADYQRLLDENRQLRAAEEENERLRKRNSELESAHAKVLAAVGALGSVNSQDGEPL